MMGGGLNNAELTRPAVTDFCHFPINSLLITNRVFGQFEVADCFNFDGRGLHIRDSIKIPLYTENSLNSGFYRKAQISWIKTIVLFHV